MRGKPRKSTGSSCTARMSRNCRSRSATSLHRRRPRYAEAHVRRSAHAALQQAESVSWIVLWGELRANATAWSEIRTCARKVPGPRYLGVSSLEILSDWIALLHKIARTPSADNLVQEERIEGANC